MASLFAIQPLVLIRQRLDLWWQSRLPHTDTLTLTQRNVYILPTGPGLMLAATLLVLLLAAINYQLNLGYLLTFLLAGSALVGMHICHSTLRGLSLSLLPPPASYAGSVSLIDIKLTSTRRSDRYGIGLSLLNPSEALAMPGATRHWAWTDVPAQSSSGVQVAFRPMQRGRHRLPSLIAETRFPLGTFRVWTVWRPAAQALVYPAPELEPPPLPWGEPQSSAATLAAYTQRGNEFDGLRAYRRGDPIKRVVWRKAAKSASSDDESQNLLVRDSAQDQRHALWLDMSQTGSTDHEHQLSRLCAWVIVADGLSLSYGLRLPGLEIQPDSSESHKRQCLEALALC